MITSMLILCLVAEAIIAKPQFNGLSASCTTANNENGMCIPIQSCNAIFQIANRSSLFPDELKYLERSVCDETQPSNVCCAVSLKASPKEMVWTPSRNDQPTNQPTTISARKCKEYEALAFNRTYFGSLINLPSEIKTPNCALRSTSLILGGTEAIKSEFPHMVNASKLHQSPSLISKKTQFKALIGYKRSNSRRIDWSCGGSLISELFVLSAAHCHDLENDPATFARLGEHDIDQTDDVTTTVDYAIIKRIVHPQYRRYYNDIMLLQLDRVVAFSSAIRPICLPQQHSISAENAIVTGWGLTKAYGDRSNVLLKANLNFFSQKECNDKYAMNAFLNMGIVEAAHLCAGSRIDDKDTCNGDSGGPIQIYKGDSKCIYTLLGVTSFGPAICGMQGTPGVYTRVYPYLNWIEKNVWPNE